MFHEEDYNEICTDEYFAEFTLMRQDHIDIFEKTYPDIQNFDQFAHAALMNLGNLFVQKMIQTKIYYNCYYCEIYGMTKAEYHVPYFHKDTCLLFKKQTREWILEV